MAMDISLYTPSFACSVVFSVVPEACADDLLLELSLLIGLVCVWRLVKDVTSNVDLAVVF